MKKIGRLTLATTAVCGLILAGCGESSKTPSPGAASDTPGAAKGGETASPAKPDSPPATAVTPQSGTVTVAAKHPWGSFKVGSLVKTKTVTKMEMPGVDPTETVMEMTQTLVALDADNATLKTQVRSKDSEESATEAKIPLKMTGSAPTDQRIKELASGSETIEVAGKKLNCKWVQSEIELEGCKTISKVWQCEQVPGFVVKMVSSSSGNMKSTTTSEVVEFAAN